MISSLFNVGTEVIKHVPFHERRFEAFRNYTERKMRPPCRFLLLSRSLST